MPSRDDDYQLPSWPPTVFNRDLWNEVFADIGLRLRQREDLEASFESLINSGIQASLDYIQVTVAPKIAGLQDAIEAAQEQIDQIIIDGVSPNSLKLGGQLPSYYATATALDSGLSSKVSTSLTINGKPLNADVTLAKADVGLGSVDNTADADKPISTPQANAFAKRLRVDAAQSFTAAEKGQAIANIGGGVLAGFRNKIINGDFDIWQRGTISASPGYLADRWSCANVNYQECVASEPLPPGVHGEGTLQFGSNSPWPAARQIIEAKVARHLAGKKATLTFWAQRRVGSSVMLVQLDTASSPDNFSAMSPIELAWQPDVGAIGFVWVKYQRVYDIPETARNGLRVLIGRGEQAIETLTRICHVSLVEGDATAEDDPFSPRHIQQELALCRRYFRRNTFRKVSSADGADYYTTVLFLSDDMRAKPTTNYAIGENVNAKSFATSGVNSECFGWRSVGPGLVVVDGVLNQDAEL